MGQVRHGSATTTHAVRAAIQRSQASLCDADATHGGISDALELVAQLDRLGDGEVAQTNMLGKPDGFGVVDMGR